MAAKPNPPPGDAPVSSRDRMLHAAKKLFSERGYESTSTAEIARMAHTSESQLIKHFGGKEGLLEAVFDSAWVDLNYTFRAIQELPTPGEKLEGLLNTMITVMERDPDLRQLMLLEGRRVRREDNTVVLTKGYLRFIQVMDAILNEMKARGELRPEMNVQAVRSGLIGLFEGLLRDQLLGERMDFPAKFSSQELRRIFQVVLNSFIVD